MIAIAKRWIAALAVLALAAPCLAAPVPSPAIHTNKTRFRIPYRYDADEMQRLGAREIRLYVSTDRGANWEHAQSVRPDAGRFDFQAPSDGEYWFAVRTLDNRNQLHPGGPVGDPGLQVVVDTRPPQLRIQLRQVEPGRVELVWSADDPHLDPARLRLEYVEPGQQDWQQVSVVPSSEGRTSWSTPRGGLVAVRGSISDLASNVGRAQSQAEIAPAGDSVPRPEVPDFSQPIARHDDRQRLADDFGETTRITPRTPLRFDPEPKLARPDDARDRLVSSRPETQPGILGSRYEPAEPEPTKVARRTGGVRIVNSRTFQIDYQVDDVGPSGLSAVEFYISTDEGQKWWRYGNDEDLRSPFAVSVPRDGVYGFALRARSGVGLAADPPQPGERPSIVVAVDRTPPVVDLAPVQQGRGASHNELLIRWNVTEENPSDAPVALSYATDRNGPWEPITGWLPDRGNYTWTIGPGVPPRMYVRLTVRDAAGNMTRVQSDEPIVVDFTKPLARIVDVESVQDGPATR